MNATSRKKKPAKLHRGPKPEPSRAPQGPVHRGFKAPLSGTYVKSDSMSTELAQQIKALRVKPDDLPEFGCCALRPPKSG